MIYIAQPDKVRDALRPSKKYLSHLLQECDLLSEICGERIRSQPTTG